MTIIIILLSAFGTGQVLAENSATPPLRSYLEPGYNRPDSAIVSGDYGYNDNLIVFSYSGDTITETTYAKNIGTWNKQNYRTESYAFDAKGNRILYIFSNHANNMVQRAGKEEYSFNSFGMTLTEKYYNYNVEDGSWMVVADNSYQYDASGLMIGGTSTEHGVSYPIKVSGTLENLVISATIGPLVVAQYVRHYDPATLKELASESYSLSDKGILELDMAYTYTYDAAGRLITKSENDMNEEFWETQYLYNNNGKRISSTEYYAERPTGPYILNSQTEYKFTNNRLDKIIQSYFSDDGSRRSDTTTFYYSGDAGVVSPDEAKVLRINASDGNITFVLPEQTTDATLQLIDLSGRTVLKTQAASDQPIAIPSLRSGVYVYRILAGRNTYTGKVYIQN
ncbi:hypothetical protein AGMMS49574_27090 [Bacteroidia bacterium]|nr:hypothetical protein AGMMS49574_27090 [Bacteroidia bacterium]